MLLGTWGRPVGEARGSSEVSDRRAAGREPGSHRGRRRLCGLGRIAPHLGDVASRIFCELRARRPAASVPPRKLTRHPGFTSAVLARATAPSLGLPGCKEASRGSPQRVPFDRQKQPTLPARYDEWLPFARDTFQLTNGGARPALGQNHSSCPALRLRERLKSRKQLRQRCSSSGANS